MIKHTNICFVTGTPQCGKTSLLQNVITSARAHRLTLGGFVAIGLWQNNRRSGFVLKDLASGAQVPLAGRSNESKEMGGFVFYPEGFATGLNALEPDNIKDKDLVIIDEIGWLETRGDGWASALPFMAAHAVNQIWVVRDAIVAEVCATWQFEPGLIVHATAADAEKQILQWLKIKA